MNRNETVIVPDTASPVRLMALASAAAGDPTPFEGTVKVSLTALAALARYARYPAMYHGATGVVGETLAIALEDFTTGAWEEARRVDTGHARECSTFCHCR